MTGIRRMNKLLLGEIRMTPEKMLYDEIKKLAENHYPTGWAGASGVILEGGQILTSVAPDVKNEGASLCMETGAYLEAFKLKKNVTHTLCLARENEEAEFIILTPCGICQERLHSWGGDVLCGITNPKNELKFVKLSHLQPHHWHCAYED